MSTVIAKNVQIGTSGTSTDNFTIFQPATPDGTLRIGNGNTGITSSFVSMTSAGAVAVSGAFSVAGNNISAVNSLGFRNRIINGDMRIDQRNAGASVTPTTAQYVLDRWLASLTVASKFSVQQNAGSVTTPSGFSNYLGVTSTSAYSVGASDAFSVQQRIEGFNTADLNFGTASASNLTLSFWVRSSLTGTFGGQVYGSPGRSYPFTYSISTANTWTYITIPVSGDTTTNTYNTTNGFSLIVVFGLGSGSSTSGGIVNTWQNGNFTQPTGTVSVVGTNGATFYITGVQLEAGSVASPFERRDYGRELIMCQRYYTKTYSDANVPGSTGSGQENAIWSSVPATNSYPQIGQWFYPVTMRATPTIVIYNPNTGTINSFRGDSANYSNAATNTIGNKGVTFYGANVSVGTSTFISVQATASAEL